MENRQVKDTCADCWAFFGIVTFLIAAGPWYRFIMYTSALLLMFITRYGIVENFLILVQQIQIMMLRKKKSA